MSGAGGGDVAVFIGPATPSPKFLERSHALGLFPLELSLDNKGVRMAPHTAPVSTGKVVVASDRT